MPKIRINGDHAIVRELNKREKALLGFKKRKRIVERKSHFPRRYYSLGMTLCNLLYPKFFPKQIASAADKRAYTTYSVRIPLAEESQKAIDAFYASQSYSNRIVREHGQKYYDAVERLAIRIEAESGIHVNYCIPNFGVKKKQGIVFFEPYSIRLGKTEEFIDKMPKGLKKKQAMELLKALRVLAQGENYLSIHEG